MLDFESTIRVCLLSFKVIKTCSCVLFFSRGHSTDNDVKRQQGTSNETLGSRVIIFRLRVYRICWSNRDFSITTTIYRSVWNVVLSTPELHSWFHSIGPMCYLVQPCSSCDPPRRFSRCRWLIDVFTNRTLSLVVVHRLFQQLHMDLSNDKQQWQVTSDDHSPIRHLSWAHRCCCSSR
jgi:hypothetical protein